MDKPTLTTWVVLALSLASGAACAQTRPADAGPVVRRSATQAAATNFGVLLGGTTELEQQLEVEASKSADAARAFGARLSAADRRTLQDTCSALVANPADAAAGAALQRIMARHANDDSEAIVRFCLEPAIARLRSDLRASRQSLQRPRPASDDQQTNLGLQDALQRQQRHFAALSNVMKTKHDTAKNSISNVR